MTRRQPKTFKLSLCENRIFTDIPRYDSEMLQIISLASGILIKVKYTFF